MDSCSRDSYIPLEKLFWRGREAVLLLLEDEGRVFGRKGGSISFCDARIDGDVSSVDGDGDVSSVDGDGGRTALVFGP